MIELSGNYLPYPHPTHIVLAGGDRARVLRGEEKTLEEIHSIDHSKDPLLEASGEDSVRAKVYAEVSEYLQSLDSVTDIILCAPEAYQHELEEALSSGVRKSISELVPKNLASLPLDAVVRILQEHTPSDN